MSADHERRFWLVMAGLWWAIIGTGYLGISDTRRWQPDVVGVVCFICTALFWILAARPHISWAYRLAGTFAVGSLLLHFVSVVFGLIRSDDPETVWVTLIWVGIVLMLFRLFWAWWLGPMKRWHEEHRAQAHATEEAHW